MIQKPGRSFINAFSGLGYFFRHEKNGRIQLILGIGTWLAAIVLHISSTDWAIVLICSGLVLSLEMLNSALEKLCNLVQPDFHPQIKIIKDVAAGAVLWASIISALIAIIIFLPKILEYV